MAIVWAVHSGKEPTRSGSRLGSLPLMECVTALRLEISGYLQPDVSPGPTFGAVDDFAMFPNWVVIQVEAAEVAGSSWRPGFYLSPTSVSDAKRLFAA